MEIEHIGHQHSLRLCEAESKDLFLCCACREYCSGPTYGCLKCDFFIHKSCAEMPQEIQNPFHPHPLTLMIAPSSQRQCDACLKDVHDFSYRCNLCDFVVDVTCAFYMPTIQDDKQLQHPTHFHPLELIDKKDDDDDYGRVCCKTCKKLVKICSSPIFGCLRCRYFLHKSCAQVLQLPPEIQHYFHPCTLTLNTWTPDLICRACKYDNLFPGIAYFCEKCNFKLDVECALLPNTIKSECEEQLLYHSSHGHPLKLCVKKEDDQVKCSVCEKQCSGQTYVCDRCKFFLHESCVGLALEIGHPFHPGHYLNLCHKDNAPLSYSSRSCQACGNECKGSTYFCYRCSFHLHIGCTELLPSIQYEGHNDHLLTLFTKKNDHLLTTFTDTCNFRCSSCNLSCRGSPMFRCVQCDFTLHLLCGPLPCTIKDKCHIHPLALTDSPVEDVDWNGFCCDVCENERDPRPAIYYCQECQFIAEISCVISEVFLTLKGEYGDAELRTSNNQFTSKVVSKSNQNKEIKTTTLTLYDLLKSFTEDEKSELNGVLEAVGKETSGTEKILSVDQNRDNDNIGEYNADSISGVLLFSDKYYKRFYEKLEFKPKDSIILWDEDEEIVAVQDSMVTRSLAPVLGKLYAKYENISADSTLRPRVKIYFNVMLCGTIDSMLQTYIWSVGDLVFTWLKNLKTLQFAGYKIQFALDHWKRVVHAYFGNEAGREIKHVFNAVDTTITKISGEIEKLTIELEAFKRERQLLRSAESAKSSLIEECLTEASILCSKAGEGLL